MEISIGKLHSSVCSPRVRLRACRTYYLLTFSSCIYLVIYLHIYLLIYLLAEFLQQQQFHACHARGGNLGGLLGSNRAMCACLRYGLRRRSSDAAQERRGQSALQRATHLPPPPAITPRAGKSSQNSLRAQGALPREASDQVVRLLPLVSTDHEFYFFVTPFFPYFAQGAIITPSLLSP